MIPRLRFRMNVRGHLAVLVLATLLPALVFFAVTLVMFHRQTHAATERGLVDTARALTIAIDRELQATITTLQALAVSEQLQAGDLRAFYATLHAVHRTRQNWSSILLYDQSGQQLINLRHPFGTPLPRSTRAADVQRVAQTRAPMITNLFRGARSGRMLVQVMVPVGAPAPKYVLGASFEPSALSAILLQQKFPADSIIALLDRNKVIIGRSRAPERFIGQPGTPDLQARMDEMAEGAFQAFTKEGQSVRAAISRSGLSGWTIALGIPEGAAAPFLSALGLVIGAGGGFIALGLVLAWLVARRLARSIGSLGPLAEDLAQGRAVQTLQSPVPEVVAVAAAIEAAGLTRSLVEAERLALLDEAERRRRAAEALAEVGRLISRSLDPEVVGQLIVDNIRCLLGARTAQLWRRRLHSDDLVMLAFSDDSGYLVRSEVWPRGTGVVGLAVERREAAFVDDALADPSVTFPPDVRVRFEKRGSQAVLAAPLLNWGQVIGALAVTADVGRAFDREEVRLAQAFADQAVVALENSRLHSDALRRGEELGALLRATRTVMQDLDLGRALELIIDEASQIAMTPNVGVFLLDRAARVLRSVAVRGASMPLGYEMPVGAGYSGTVAETGRPLFVDNVQNDPANVLAAHDREAGTQAYLGLPIVSRDEVLGVLTFTSQGPRQYGADEIAYLASFADQAAVAIANARLFAETGRRRRAAESLAAVGRLISESLDPERVGQLAVESLCRLVDARIASLYRLDPTSGDLVFVAGVGVEESWNRRLASGAGAVGLAVRERQPVTTTDLLSDPRISLAPEARAWIERTGYRAVLAVPLLLHDRVVGALGVGAPQGRTFEPDEIDLAQAFADQVALAFQNATLVSDLKARQARLAALLEASYQLSAIQPLDALLTKIAEGCGTLLGSDSVGLRIVEGDELVVAGTRGDADRAMPTKRLKVGESLSGVVAQTGEPLSITNIIDDPRLLPAHREAVRALGHQGWLGVPVKAGDRVLGVLSIRTRDERGFSEEDMATAMAFAAHAAVALENARLYGELRQAYEELSRTQDQLTQAQKMEAMGRLAGGVAHDFNNLLTVILGRAAMLRSRLGADGDGSRHAVLIQETAGRAARLTRQLLAFSRKQDLKPKVLDLNALVAPTSLMLRRLIGEDIDFITRLGSGLWNVKADPGQLEQVLMNLTVNARDAMPNGGRLTLETANVEVGEPEAGRVGLAPGAYVMLALSDTGVGMPPEVQAQIFEPFFTTKGPGKGTGLGLATVYGIVTQSDGHITLESVPTQGTTFRIYLPRVEAPIDSAPADGPREAPRGTETILLVEDEPEVRDLIREMLEAHGYTVLSALDGIEALDVAERHSGTIHLLLTDVIMPQMSGRQLAERLAAVRPQTKILYMSGYTDGELGHHGVLDPDIMLAEKPFTPPEIARKVREALDGGRHGRRNGTRPVSSLAGV